MELGSRHLCGYAMDYVHTGIPILAPEIVEPVILTNEPFLHPLLQPVKEMEINGNWQCKANKLFVVFSSWKNCWLASCILDHVYPSLGEGLCHHLKPQL